MTTRLLQRIMALLLGLACLQAVAADTPLAQIVAQTIQQGAGNDRLQLAGRREVPNDSMGLYRQFMRDPLRAPFLLGAVEAAVNSNAAAPGRLMILTTQLGDTQVVRGYAENPFAQTEQGLLQAVLPLREALTHLLQRQGRPAEAVQQLADTTAFPRPWQLELGRLIGAVTMAKEFRDHAFRKLPAEATRDRLLEQVVGGQLVLFAETDFRELLPLVDREALAAGMQILTRAVADFAEFLRQSPVVPELDWRLDTSWGPIVIDTRNENSHHEIETPLLLIDLHGNDRYRFLPAYKTPSTPSGISILIDWQGNDRYLATVDGTCPSAAILGFGVLWDEAGDDLYQARNVAQAAALFGAAMLYEGGGTDVFEGEQFIQSHATGGFALLIEKDGHDRYQAISRSQASAGPQGVALVLDQGGNDEYELLDSPKVIPSAQLPDHSLSMGQGAATGLRATFADGHSVAGGIGLLIDRAGNDRYTAQVFAQGAGYYRGLGALIDGGGHDHFMGRWYVQGAAAHEAAAVLLKRGEGNDSYTATHSTSIGAAHDESVAVFVDEGGDDAYELGHLGLGAANDNASALFIDAGGNDRYSVKQEACQAFGAAIFKNWGTAAESLANTALFLDLGGDDHYPSACQRVRNGTSWSWPRRYPDLRLPSEAGGGVDGLYPIPLLTKPQTLADKPADATTRHRWRSDPGYLVAPRGDE